MIPVPGELSCKEMVELMNDYLEDRLSPAELSDFERHLVFCDGCAEYLRQLRQVGAAARRLREDDIPEGARDSLLEAFRKWKRE
jgi:anti-sigma factor RsiW